MDRMNRNNVKTPPWVASAKDQLLQLKGSAPGWGYRPQSDPFVEPTVLACMAFLAQDEEPDSSTLSTVHSSADWLAAIQQPNGSVGISSRHDSPRWPTAHALLLWSALGSHEPQRAKAKEWLLQHKGAAFPKDKDSPVGHDTTIVGWPWVADTHSWIEPTCSAILALTYHGETSGRVSEGLRLLVDRVISTGGWNYGNNMFFGNALRPQPAPTGWVLLALTKHPQQPSVVLPALRYLEEVLPTIRSAQSLCWGLLGLETWNRRPDAADLWLQQAHDAATRRSDVAVQLSYLLLAGGREALTKLGVKRRTYDDKS